MLRGLVYRFLYVVLWMFLVLDAFLIVLYPISILITVGVTLLLLPAILLILFCQYCLASILDASGFFTREGTRSLLKNVKFFTSGFGLIRSAWLYASLIIALTVGMYLLFRNHHPVKSAQPPPQHTLVSVGPCSTA